MSERSVWISERLWRRWDATLRRDLREALGGRELATQRYVCNVCADLRARGEHDLAARLLEAVAVQR